MFSTKTIVLVAGWPLRRRMSLMAALATLLVGPTLAQTMTPAQPPGSGVAPAAATSPWTLQAAVDYALAHNLAVRATELTAQQTDATQRLNRAALHPTASLNGSQNFNFGTNRDPFTNTFQNLNARSNNFSANVQATVFSGFQLRNTIKQGQFDAQAARFDIDKARNDLSLEVASSFLQLLLAQELIRASEARLGTVRAQVTRSEKLLKAGAVAEGNVLDSRAQLASEERTLVTARNQRDLSQLALVQQLNLNPTGAAGFQVVVPVLPDPTAFADDLDPDATFELSRRNLPQIKAADLRVESARRGLHIARGAYYPRLRMGGGVSTGYSSARPFQVKGEDQVVSAPILERDSSGALLPSPYVLVSKQPTVEQLPYRFLNQLRDGRGAFVQFDLNIPILNGQQTRVGVQRAQIGIQQNELRAEQTRLQLRQTIQQSFADALAAQRRFAASARQVEALSLAFRNAEIRFNNGLLNGTDFNIARNNLTAAESDMIQAKYEYFFRRKTLDFYQGKPLTL